MREFRYGVANHKESDGFLKRVKEVDGVSSAKIEGNEIVYSLTDDADEYEVLASIVDISDEEGVSFFFDVANSDDNRPIGGDLAKKDGDLGLENEVMTKGNEDGDEGASSTMVDYSVSYEEVIAQQEKRQIAKGENKFRLGELIFATALLIASFFFKATGELFSAKTILIILSFAIAGYDVVYNAFFDIIKKRPLDGNLVVLVASVSLILLGQPTYSALLTVLFASAKYILSLCSQKTENLLEDAFYTGGVIPVEVNGKEVSRSSLKVGDEMTLKEGEIVPCDSVATSVGEVDSFLVDYNLSSRVSAGDKVYAGSAVLSETLSLKTEKLYGEGLIDQKKKAFEEKLDSVGSKSLNNAKIFAPIIDLVLIIAAILVTFLLPLTEESYSDGLEKWALYGAVILSVSLCAFAVKTVSQILKHAYASALINAVSFGDYESFEKLSKANSLKVKAAVLLNGDKTDLKEDALGAMTEFLNSGIKNVTTDFDGENLPKDLKQKIDFVDKPFNGERIVKIGCGEGDLGLGGGDNAVFSGEVSFLPYAYKMAKRSRRKALWASILSIFFLGVVAGLFLIPLATLTTAFYVAISGAISLLIAIIALSSTSKLR